MHRQSRLTVVSLSCSVGRFVRWTAVAGAAAAAAAAAAGIGSLFSGWGL